MKHIEIGVNLPRLIYLVLLIIAFYVKLTKNNIKCMLKIVSKLDELKEILNTLRVAMSLSFGMLVIVVSGIIKRFDDANVDSIFWLGTLFSVYLSDG